MRDEGTNEQRSAVGLFVDDVREAMRDIVAHRFLFAADVSPSPHIIAVPGWREAEAAIAEALGDVTLERRRNAAERAR